MKNYSTIETIFHNNFSHFLYANVFRLTAVINTNGLSNAISTTKYSLLTWLPKSIWEQFRRVANVYFLMISILMVRNIVSYTFLS